MPFTDKTRPMTDFLFHSLCDHAIFAMNSKSIKMTQNKKLYRTIHNKVIGGVAGGLAEYFDVDVVVFRLLFVLLVLFGGGGLLAYIVMWIVIPPGPAPAGYQTASAQTPPAPNQNTETGNNSSETPTSSRTTTTSNTTNTGLVAGILLILIGTLLLLNRVMPWVNFVNFWPVLLIITGFFIIDPTIFKSSKNNNHEI